LDLALNLPSDGPRGLRLVEALREAILSGRLDSRARLPASRLLAAQLGLSRGTVVAAYEELIGEGYCVARVGAGTFVADLSPPPPPRNGEGETGVVLPQGRPDYVRGPLSRARFGQAGRISDPPSHDWISEGSILPWPRPSATSGHLTGVPAWATDDDASDIAPSLAGGPQAAPQFPEHPAPPPRIGPRGGDIGVSAIQRAGGWGLSSWGRRLSTPPRTPAPAEPVRFDFRRGTSPSDFPAAALGRALRHAAMRLVEQDGPGNPAGSPRLRRALVSYLGRARGLRADTSQVVIVNGSQQGVDLAARLLLDPGDRVCIEEPGYPRARECFRALGAALVPLPVDRGGLVTRALPEDGARMAYVTPSHQYPTGAVLAPDRRLALLAWAEHHEAWILEDDYDSEFRYIGPPLPCLQGLDRAGRCLYLGTLSKLLHPALRTGYLVVPPELAPAAVAAKSALDQATTPLIQEALADLFESGEIERHLRRASRAYRIRRAALIEACAAHFPPDVRVWPVTGGLHAYIEVPGVAADALRLRAKREGLGLGEGADCYSSARPGASLILWFSRIPTGQIEPGIAALGRVVAAARE
jgi:GntR family transcriptional regulator/MocR family aminotransferase